MRLLRHSVVLCVIVCSLCWAAQGGVFINRETGTTLHGRVVQEAKRNGKDVVFVRLEDGSTRFLRKDKWKIRRAGPAKPKTRAARAYVLILQRQYLEAADLLKKPKTPREKGLRALLVGRDQVGMRRCGFTEFDPEQATRLAEEALPQLEAEAETDSLSAGIVSRLYLLGVGVAQSDEKGVRYCKIAAEAGDPMSMRSMAALHRTGRHLRKDVRKSIRWLRRAADAGSTLAMCQLAGYYMSGEGLQKDETKAGRLYLRASQQGDSEAMLLNGGVKLNEYAEAMEAYNRLAERRPRKTKAMKRLKRKADAKAKEFLSWTTRAAEAGHATGCALLGSCYEDGSFGAEENQDIAYKWFRRAAQSGIATHVLQLARCYRRGLGVEQDYTEADKLYGVASKAAKKQGDDETLKRVRRLQKAKLLLMSWHWRPTASGAYVTAEGQVANVSGQRLKNVTVVVVFYTKQDELVTSDSSLIEFNPLMPGQSSPFKVMVRRNPRISKASVHFKELGGKAIPHADY